MKKSAIVAVLLTLAAAVALVSREPQSDSRLKGAFRRPERNGWTFVHLQGAPAEVGFQHGYLLAAEIADNRRVIETELQRDTKHDWQFFRDAARDVFWPHIEQEYRDELTGIARGIEAHGGKLDVWDVTALNAFLEFTPYYSDWYDKQHKLPPTGNSAGEHCSAFVATGSYTRDGRVVIGHNNWSSYAEGARWNIVFDIVPAAGYRILMDGMAGLIHSGDDFGVNSAGILITETTISQFSGFDPNGVPEFERARKALQYSNSIDDFDRIMRAGNNGGYANDWLIADRKTNEIASLELGLKHVNLKRTRDGYFVGSNYPIDPDLAREETDFPVKDMSASGNARHARWVEIMAEYKGKIDVAAGQKFLADHHDTFEGKEDPDERTLCGHIDLSPRGSKPWQPPYGPAGAVQCKVSDGAMAEKMSLTAALGHSCGIHFRAAAFLKQHKEFAWAKDILRDVSSHSWTTFQSAGR